MNQSVVANISLYIIMYYIVLYLYIYIGLALLVVHANQKRFHLHASRGIAYYMG